MAKQIKLTEDHVNNILSEIKNKLLSGKWAKGELKLSYSLTKDKRRATVTFTPIAWLKLISLVNSFSTEVQWHGLIRRVSESSFLVYDVIVPPHTVTSATVTSDEEKYAEWMINLDIDVYRDLKFHGHSHVNMGCTPSSVDEAYREKIVSQLPSNDEDAFYVFMIFNKSMVWTGEIYDPAHNALYETSDIDLIVSLGESETLTSFLGEAKKLAVEKKEPIKPVTSYWDDWNKKATVASNKHDEKKTESHKKKENDDKKKSSIYDADSDDFDIFGYYKGRYYYND